MHHWNWEKNYRSKRKDNRHITSNAALREKLCFMEPKLHFSDKINKCDFVAWKEHIGQKLFELLKIPELPTNQPIPNMIWEKQRDGYKTQRWEFYPDEWTAVPVLILLPNEVSESHPGAAVLCCPGSAHSKEFLAGEDLPEHPNYRRISFPERNMMAKHFVQAGFIAVVFDNPGTGELAERGPDIETQWKSRNKFSGELLCSGSTYPGLSVFQKMCFLEWFKQQYWVDQTRLAVCGHSLGAEAAMFLGVLCEDIKAVIYNDFLCDEQRRRMAVTNYDEPQDIGNWHYIPSLWKWCGFSDILAALAPKPLLISEGGPWEFTQKIRSAYRLTDAEHKLQICYYPEYSDPDSRKYDNILLPDKNLSTTEFFEYCYVNAPEHSFRSEYAIPWIQKTLNDSFK